ncbi:hemerythrin domain-containing protein [Aeromicrobium terrae]|uniref:Hemerythrin domain-containing protein n=1 Tax=Aeromicrobium terrae TaxID=2498846 RepID=A0A5C8NK62_9ACTN|nr:hemerythrin domain-containing protein [Aeromicrobium terrae]TXL61540.1 hemerythrin domain-containing protein [Aeromicrobium terrae]
MSTTAPTTYPDQLMLPGGQAAAPGGPVDMMMMYVMHHGFRRDLTRFAAAAAATPVDDHRTWQALETRWAKFGAILHHHHSGEDAGIWPFLLERADEDERSTLEAMEEEHSHIDPLLTACGEGFAELAGDRAGRTTAELEDVRAALQVRVAATRDALSRHLQHEESEAMVILQRHMSQADWEEIEETHFREPDGDLTIVDMIGWCAEAVPPKELREIFAKVGRPFQVIWWLTRGRFKRQEHRAFRYAGV